MRLLSVYVGTKDAGGLKKLALDYVFVFGM